MKISNLARISQGELINSPFIDSIIYGHTNPHRVKQGDFFVGDVLEDITLALQSGAYAIICETTHESLDDEIAWIKVKNRQKSLLSILRYKLSQKSKIILVDTITFYILKQITQNKDCFFLDDITNHFEILYKEDFNYIFTNNKTYAKTLDTNFTQFEHIEQEFTIIKQNPLYCSFCYDDIYLEDIKIISLFLPNLLDAFYISKFYGFEVNVSKLDYFEPVEITYIDNGFKEKEFGKSEKIYICIKDDKIEREFLEQLQLFYKWCNFLLLQEDTTLLQTKPFHFIISKKKFSIIADQFSQSLENRRYESLF